MSHLRVERWSPLFNLTDATLTTSGLLEIDTINGEVEVLTRENVELRISTPLPRLCDIADGKQKRDDGCVGTSGVVSAAAPPSLDEKWIDRDAHLICILTTHRVVFQEDQTRTKYSNVRASCIDLCLVNGAISSGGGLSFSSTAKIKLSTFAYGEIIIAFACGTADRDAFLSSLHKCLYRKAWLQNLKKRNQVREKRVGVDAIIAKNMERHEDAKRVSDSAFSSDVDGLMSEARELVQVINKYVATLEKKQQADVSAGPTKKSADNDEEILNEMLRSMGIMTAITKSSTGTMYHRKLARQMTEFLRQGDRLERAGGMMTLTDVYCVFNRARGTNLISPDDLVEVLDQMKNLKLGFSRRQFASGVIVVQSDQYSDKAMAKKLRDLIEIRLSSSNGAMSYGITAFETSRELKISAVLALEQLQSAESLGILCRDATMEGVRFFCNAFTSGKWVSKR